MYVGHLHHELGPQEVDQFNTFYKDALLREGYNSVYIQRGNQKRDGCGIFFRHSKYNEFLRQSKTYTTEIYSLLHYNEINKIHCCTISRER
jgi:CCR4-NOT transcription complex subunit 6